MKKGGLGSLPKGLEWLSQSSPKSEPKAVAPQPKKIAVAPKAPVVAKQPVITKPVVTKVEQPVKPVQIQVEPIKFMASEKPKVAKQSSESASAGLPEGYTRATFIIKKDHVERLKALAYVNKTPIKDLVDQAMTKFLKDRDVATILREAVKTAESSEN